MIKEFAKSIKNKIKPAFFTESVPVEIEGEPVTQIVAINPGKSMFGGFGIYAAVTESGKTVKITSDATGLKLGELQVEVVPEEKVEVFKKLYNL